MATAMAKGFINSGLVKAGNITVSDLSPAALGPLMDIGVKTTKHNREVLCGSELIVVAVKPNIVKQVLEEVSPNVQLDKQVFVSIAAGVTINSLEQALPKGTRVIRVMPNTPVLVQAGASVLSTGTSALKEDSQLVKTLLGSVGICEETEEPMLDAVTGLSGSGPAYIFHAVELMAHGGLQMGLSQEEATKMAAQVLMEAAKMVQETGKHPSQLKDEWCLEESALGSLNVMKSGGARSAINTVEISNGRRKSVPDVVTCLRDSGPAFAFHTIEAMADGGVKMGLPQDLAIKLATQTVMGAAKMVLETGKHPGQLKEEVCSPGGTTIAGMGVLELLGFNRSSIIEAVETATRRSITLGKQ